MDENVESSEALGLNAQHEVVGWYDAGSGKRPFIWLPTAAYGLAAGAHDINDVMGLSTSVDAIAYSINDDGLIAGVFDFFRDPKLLAGEAFGGAAFVWDISTWDDTTPVTLDITALVDSGSETSIEGVATAISNDDPAVVVGWTTLKVPCWQCGPEPDESFRHVPYAFRLELDDISNLDASDVEFQVQTETMTGTAAYGIAPLNTTPADVAGAILPPDSNLCADNQQKELIGCPELLGTVDPCLADLEGVGWYWSSSSTANLLKLTSDPERHHWALDVNTDDNIVGRGGLFDSGANECTLVRALYWDFPGGFPLADPVDLTDELTGSNQSDARAITSVLTNDFIYVVGSDFVNNQAAIWERDDQDDWAGFILDDFIIQSCSLWEANDVTDDLWVAGWGRESGSSDNRAYVLQPVGDCIADLDGNGCVDGMDLAILLGQWDESPCTPGCKFADLTGDGCVDGADLAILLGEWCDEACQCPGANCDEEAFTAASEGNYLPLYAWLVSENEVSLAVQLIETTGISE